MLAAALLSILWHADSCRHVQCFDCWFMCFGAALQAPQHVKAPRQGRLVFTSCPVLVSWVCQPLERRLTSDDRADRKRVKAQHVIQP